MPENDFEKQVQQLFAELRLKPSEEVWPKVSSRIRKEKARRRAFIWIPLSLLLLGTGGYGLLQYYKNRPTRGDFAASAAAGNNTLDANLDKHGSGSDAHASNGSQHSLKPPVNVQMPGNPQQQARPAAQLPASDHTGMPVAIGGIRGPYPVKESDKTKAAFPAGEETLPAGNKALVITPPLAALQFVTGKTLSLPEIETDRVLKGVHQDDVAANAPVKLAKKKVWEWGISGGGGVASLTGGLSGLFGDGNEKETNMNAMPNDPNTTNNPGYPNWQNNNNNMVTALPPPASPVREGLAWQSGGFVKWKVNPRMALTGGLQYSYYSTGRMVGNDINSYRFMLNYTLNNANASYAGYYPGGQHINYVNRYHFVEVPVGIQWQFNRFAIFPLQLNGGLSLSRMINTTAVHYDAQTGSYYKDKALFNKMRAGIYAGSSVTIFANSRRPLYIGPRVQYDLTRLLKLSANADQHFIYAGLKAEWILGKK